MLEKEGFKPRDAVYRGMSDAESTSVPFESRRFEKVWLPNGNQVGRGTSFYVRTPVDYPSGSGPISPTFPSGAMIRIVCIETDPSESEIVLTLEGGTSMKFIDLGALIQHIESGEFVICE